MKIAHAINAAVLIALAGCTSVPSGGLVPETISHAETSAEHLQIADYYSRKATSYDAEAAWHEKPAHSYLGRPKGDPTAMAAHCRSLSLQFTNSAREARALEHAHRQLARSAADTHQSPAQSHGSDAY